MKQFMSSLVIRLVQKRVYVLRLWSSLLHKQGSLSLIIPATQRHRKNVEQRHHPNRILQVNVVQALTLNRKQLVPKKTESKDVNLSQLETGLVCIAER